MAADPVTADTATPPAADRPWTGIHTAAAVAAIGGPLLAPTFGAADRSWTASPFPVLATWVVVGLVAQVAVWWVPRRLGRTPPRPMSIVWATFGFFSFRPIWEWIDDRGLPDGPLVAAAIGLVLLALGWVIGGRLDGSGWVLLAALGVGAVLTVADGAAVSPLVPDHRPVADVPIEAPSMVVVVVDSFPSPRALAADGWSIESFRSDLEALGFRVWDDARTNYTRTWMAVPSMLDGDYPVAGPFGPEETAALHSGLGGGTSLLASAQAGGSRLEFHEASWSLSRCDEIVDRCARGLWRSEITDAYLAQTPLPAVFPRALVETWTRSGLDVLSAVDQPPDDTIAIHHATLPHVPFNLRPDCTLQVEGSTGAQAQIDCTGRLLVEAGERIDLDRTTVVVVGDHGFGFKDQLTTDPDEWTPEMVLERFGVFLAVSTPDDCEMAMPDPMSVVNVLPWVMSCGDGFEPLPDRHFVSRSSDAATGDAVEIDWPVELGG